MNLSEKGWYNRYIQFRKGQYDKGILHATRHHDISLYNLLQPTGILYGTPVEPEHIDKNDFYNLSEDNKLKILIAESLINSCILFNESNIHNEDDYIDTLNNAAKNISSFYINVFPEYKVRARTIWGASKPDVEVAEDAIHNRIFGGIPDRKYFWSHFYYKSFIFLDIYLFGQWINLKSEKILIEYFRQEKEDLRFTILKILIAAASANYVIAEEERNVFNQYLKVAGFPKSREKIANKLLSTGISVDEIELPQNNSWLLKKFFLELAISMVWADREVDEFEETFLENLSYHLGFVLDDLEKSKVAIEGFIITHWEEMLGLHGTKNPDNMKKDYLRKILRVTKRNENKIQSQLKVNEPMMRLIKKYNSGEIISEDENRLRDFLLDLVQQLPTFKSIVLPRPIFTLPVLFKLLPESNDINH